MYQCAGGLGCKIMILRRNKWATFNALMSSSLIFMTWWTILIESSFSSYSIQLFYPHGFPDNLSEANFDFFFNVLLTVHLCIILSIKPIWCTIFLSMFIYFLYMFRASVPITRRNNCIYTYATLGTCYSVWMSVWYAGLLCTLHTRQSFIQNNKYQMSQK